MRMAGITTHENPLVQGIFISDTLADGVDRVPFDAVPLDVIRLENPLSGSLDLVRRGRLSRVPVGVCRRCDLHVKADHIVFTRDDHNRAAVGVDRAFCLLRQYISCHWSGLRTSISGKSVRTTPSMTPHT